VKSGAAVARPSRASSCARTSRCGSSCATERSGGSTTTTASIREIWQSGPVRLAILASFALAASGCGDDLIPARGPDLALHDEIFASLADDGVLCAANANDNGYTLASIRDALDRARDDGTIVQLFLHDPGKDVSLDKLESIFKGVVDRGLRFVTYRDLAHGDTTGPAIALGFDDWWVDDWAAQRELFARYGARVTFFVALYPTYTDAQKAELAELAQDGHDIEFHGSQHLDGPAYVDANGLPAYLSAEIDPGLAAMRADGYDPIVFAYPAGKRTPAMDEALLPRFTALRATTLHCPH
jgi:hypothetical protein